ncbi:MAG: YabP/YqfC family sporulation protein [Oscillospiraceae bacterium]|nr:YabP/YqfC family sporulation protein [Oscillospiraceae bacterium]
MKRSDDKKKMPAPVRYLRSLFFDPGQQLIRPAGLSIRCNGEIEVENCKGITHYSEEKIEIDMGGLRVQIKGDALTLRHLTKGAMGVCGRPISLEFIYGE